MVVQSSNGVQNIELTRDEIWQLIEQDAQKYLGLDADTFICLYRAGKLEDTNAANAIAMLVELGDFAE